MFDKFSERIIKIAKYGLTPVRYPDNFFRLWSVILANRPLIGELVHLTDHRLWYEKTGFNTIIDIGGFIGSYAMAMKTMLPEVSLYSFEPIKSNFDQLVSNLKRFNRFTAFNTALGDESGMIDFWQNKFTASSSILDIHEEHIKAFPVTEERKMIQVPISRLDDYLDMLELISPVLLKMDVQGYEDKVIKGGGKVLEKVDYIITEVSFRNLYKGQTLFDDIYQQLSDFGFRYAGNFETLVSPKDGSILQADALFCRE